MIRAKQKAADAMPAWANCCKASVESNERVYAAGEVYRLTGEPFLTEATCVMCGHFTPHLKAMMIHGRTDKAVLLYLFDLDEGPE